MSKGLTLLVADSYGVYVPQRFTRNFDCVNTWAGVSAEDVAVLTSDPDHEHYWETWDDVLKNATYSNADGRYRLYQDGDLWAYCEELLTPEERKFLGFEGTAHDPA